jgi:hypothetical protein
VEILAHADALYQHLIVTAERKFWRCVESVEQPRLFGVRISSTSKPGRSLVPEDAKKALGHGVRAKRSKMDECREAAGVARPNDSCLTATYFTKLR